MQSNQMESIMESTALSSGEPEIRHILGKMPCRAVCPNCKREILTRVIYNTAFKTHVIAGILCCFLCWPCVCLPYCMDTCRDANHYCPNCDEFIGTHFI